MSWKGQFLCNRQDPLLVLRGQKHHYLRVVDVFLKFPNDDVLLVSDFEADRLGSSKRGKPHFCLLRSALDGQVLNLEATSLVLGSKSEVGFPQPRTRHLVPSDAQVAII